MKMPEMIVEGFMGLPEDRPFITTAENKKNTQNVLDNWMLGPESPSLDKGSNKPFWSKLAKAWNMPEEQARRRSCGNCEYFCNGPIMQAKMEKIPLTEMDQNAGGRGFCKKFDFICHGMRVCQAWDD